MNFLARNVINKFRIPSRTFVKTNREKLHIKGKVGDNVLYLAHRYNIELEGACEASLACSTCHVYVEQKYFEKLPEASDGEEDMLDLAVFLKMNSRLDREIAERFPQLSKVLTKSADNVKHFYSAVQKYADNLDGELIDPTQDLQKIPSLLADFNSELIDYKRNEATNQMLLFGEECEKHGDFESAASVYRNALLHASDVDQLSQANRRLAAVLHRSGHHALCIWHLLQHKRLSKSMTTLSKASSELFTTSLQKLMKKNKPMWKNFSEEENQLDEFIRIMCSQKDISNSSVEELKYGPHSEYGGLSSGLKLSYSEQKGRHLIAEKSFKPGDVIAKELPGDSGSQLASGFCLLTTDERPNYCGRCLSSLKGVGAVCDGCTSLLICPPGFGCGLDAGRGQGTDAFPPWHAMECRFIYILDALGIGHLCYRMLCLRYLEHGSFSNFPYHRPKDTSIGVDELLDNFDKFSCENLFSYALTGWLIAKIFMLAIKKNSSTDKGNVDEVTVGEWCFRQLLVLQCNAHAVARVSSEFAAASDVTTTVEQDASSVEVIGQRRVASALYPQTSLLNHACKPSVSSAFTGPLLVMRAIKYISPGDEVFNCYGPQYPEVYSTKKRRRMLAEQYFFDCDCQCCEQAVEPRKKELLKNSNYKDLVKMMTPESVIRMSIPQLVHHCQQIVAMTKKYDFREGLKLLDDLAKELLSFGPNFCVQFGIILQNNAELVSDIYGELSIQYAWELVKLYSGNQDASIASKVKHIFSVHYGDRQAEEYVAKYCK